MNKSDKQKGKLTLSLDQELIDKLKALADTTRIPYSRLVNEAITDLLKKHGAGGKD
jgi:predicted transcriptional regulator